MEGVGALSALAFVLILEDPYRFEKSRAVGAYVGLVPGTEQSGESDPQQRISKEGDELLRRLMVGCAHYILGPLRKRFRSPAPRPQDSRSWRQERQEVGAAVARKLSVLLHSLWVTAEVYIYEPLRNTHRAGGQAAV